MSSSPGAREDSPLSSTGGAVPQAAWRQRPERSNMLMLRVMTWISLRLGRSAGR